MCRLNLLIMGLFISMNTFAGNGNSKDAMSVNSSVPTWEFLKCMVKPTNEQLAQIPDDYIFGKEAFFLYNQLKSLCVKRIPIIPGDPTTRIVFSKGELFNAVRKVERDLEDKVKNNRITQNEATKLLISVLNVALSAYYDDESLSFEKALKKTQKKGDQLIALFSRVSLK